MDSVVIQSGVFSNFCDQEDNDNISGPLCVCGPHFSLVLWPVTLFGYYTSLCMHKNIGMQIQGFFFFFFFVFTWFGNDILMIEHGIDLSVVAY